MTKIWTIVRKEWSEVFKNRFVLFAVAFMPIIFTLIPLIILYTLAQSGEMSEFSLGEFSSQFAAICAGLNDTGCNQFVIITQFMPMFLMMPVIIPITVASYSIVGEKTTRTLEPLLATPITTAELLGGKGLAAALPAIVATWGGFMIFVVGAAFMGLSPGVLAKFFEPLWLIAIFILGPLLALAAVSLSVMISSRTTDPRVAEQISGLFILPIVGLVIAQASGLLFIDNVLIGYISLFMLALDLALLYFATQLFQRETILTRWK
jgi:ABC-2 type transport system permease protein